nr:hypothetical protein [Salmonella enterica subsp. diarizonae]
METALMPLASPFCLLIGSKSIGVDVMPVASKLPAITGNSTSITRFWMIRSQKLPIGETYVTLCHQGLNNVAPLLLRWTSIR